MGKILLFDIDQTLLYTGGAGSHAMTIAFNELWGVPDAFAGFAFAGRTDPAIMREAFLKHGVPIEDAVSFSAAVGSFHTAYVGHLEGSLKTITGGSVLPGVLALLELLLTRDDVYVGLATGNFRRGAEVKLAHYGLSGYFLDGGFGDDAEDRGEMVAIGGKRMAAHPKVAAGAHEIVVIGDTEHDINAGKVNGYRTIGVATGRTTRAELLGHGADFAFDDLSDARAVLAAFGLE